MSRWVGVVAVFACACGDATPERSFEQVRLERSMPVQAPDEPAAVVVAPSAPATPGVAVAPAPSEPEEDDDPAWREPERSPPRVAERVARVEEGEAAGELPVIDPGPTPVFVTLDGSGSRTRKPVRNAAVGHSWGWGTATDATREKCERANSRNAGRWMWCATEDKPEGSAQLISRLKPRSGRSVFVEPADVAGWGVAAPVGPVWLIGPDRVCAAAVGRPLVGFYSIEESGERLPFKHHFTILELAWELTGCEEATEAWAPIGVAAATLDASLRWVRVKAGPRQRFDPATWTGVLAREVAKLPEAAKSRGADAPEWWMQALELPGSELGELFVGAVWGDTGGTDDPDKYHCASVEFGAVFQHHKGRRLGRKSHGELGGGLVGRGSEAYLIWDAGRDYAVARVEGRKLGPTSKLSTGGHHPESGRRSGYHLVHECYD